MKNLWLIILIGGLGAGCGKQENAEAGKPGAVTPKPPPTQPEVVEKTKPAEPKPKPTAIKPKPVPPKAAVPPKPLPPALVTAWEKAGFVAGWMGPHKEFGYISFPERMKELDVSKALPAFRLGERKPRILESLPTPTSAFVLVLSGTELADAGLKGVAKLQQLIGLNLMGSKQITDAGLKEVTKLQRLTRLNLGDCEQITDAGLKEVAKPQQLTSLYLLWRNQITGAGVAELKKALPKCEIHH